MYLPPAFEERRLPVLHEAMRASGLATLVTTGPDGPEATHLPLLLEPEAGPCGTLYGHLARANPQWRELEAGAAALAIFLGPDAYVTPSWYPSKPRTGRVVPTWNYVAVHAHGPLRLIEDAERLRALVTRLTERHEAARPEPWQVADAPEPFIQAQLKAIVGFELTIERLEGKWKMSQNRAADDRAGVLDGLARQPGAAGEAAAAVMAGLGGRD